MPKLILRIYDFLRTHKTVGISCFVVLTAVLALMLSRQTYKEDISDFLPVDGDYQTATDTYRRIAGADRLFVLVGAADTASADADMLVDAVSRFEELLAENDSDGIAHEVTATADLDHLAELTDSVYAVIPLLLTEADYDSIEARLSRPGYVASMLAEDRQQLMLPLSNLVAAGISKDPARLFQSAVERLQRRGSNLNYELYDGCVFTPDMKQALLMVESPFGSSETAQNGRLLEMLKQTAAQTMADCPQTSVRITGGPAIAVDNANQIRHDSLIAVALALVLIMLLLLRTIRSIRNIMLIALAVGWGWLFAMGVISVVHHHVSLIVIGISSLIIGIAVNYPLHLVAHLRHNPDRKGALKDIVAPLLVGNVTTVGAFLALVPLKSVALKDLGLFAALLLVGTILFVLLLLPHLTKVEAKKEERGWLARIGGFSLESRPWIAIVVSLMTVVLLFFSFHTRFDANLNHINYMTDEQRADMAALSAIVSQPDSIQTVYAVSTGTSLDQALEKSDKINRLFAGDPDIRETNSCHGVLTTSQELDRRLDRWRQFVGRHGEQLKREVSEAARNEGFAEGAFEDFFRLLGRSWDESGHQQLAFLRENLFKSNVIADSANHDFRVIDVIQASSGKAQALEERMEAAADDGFIAFDAQRLNSTIATNLSDNFNYIGWACGLIVFLFLWFSFGSLELAMLSFLPMAVSWVWILGLMALTGIQFNVVNVILATFIFGQGDDYTIFMTEGCQYEYAYRRKMLESYKSSIILSALIMFIGIGTLIIAKHPALRSLAQLTILGMFSVVLTAYLFPPLIFRWMVKKGEDYRLRPLSLSLLWRRMRRRDEPDDAARCRQLVADRYRYKGTDITSDVRRNMRRHGCYERWAAEPCPEKHAVVINSGYGEFALLLALRHPQTSVTALEADSGKTLVAKYAAEGAAANLTAAQLTDDEADRCLDAQDLRVYLLHPDGQQAEQYSRFNPIVIN